MKKPWMILPAGLIFGVMFVSPVFSAEKTTTKLYGRDVIVHPPPQIDRTTTGEVLVEYSNPEWVTDDEILALKVTSRYKHDHSWLAQATKGTRKLKDRKYQVVSFNLQSREERVVYEGVPIESFSYNDDRKLLALVTGLEKDYEEHPFGFREIVLLEIENGKSISTGIDGSATRLSPQGDMLLYSMYGRPYSKSEEKGTFVYFIDDGKSRKLFSFATHLKTWDPNNGTVIYSKTIDKEQHVLRIDPYTSTETAFEHPGKPEDWSRDGSCYLGGWLYTIGKGWKELPVYALLGKHKRLSPGAGKIALTGGLDTPEGKRGGAKIYDIATSTFDNVFVDSRTLEHKKILGIL